MMLQGFTFALNSLFWKSDLTLQATFLRLQKHNQGLSIHSCQQSINLYPSYQYLIEATGQMLKAILISKAREVSRTMGSRPVRQAYKLLSNKYLFCTNRQNRGPEKKEHQEKKEDHQLQVTQEKPSNKNVQQITTPGQQDQTKKAVRDGASKKAWNYIVDSWKHTFPDEEYEVKRLQQQRRKNMRQMVQKIKSMETQATQQNAIVSLKDQKAEEMSKQRSQSNLFANSLGARQHSQPDQSRINVIKPLVDGIRAVSYIGNQVLQGVRTGDGLIGKGIKKATQYIGESQTVGNATEQMRRIDGKFQTVELETEAKYIFVNCYNDFLQGKYDTFQRICGDQGYQFFKSYRQIYKARNITPYQTELMNVSDITLQDAIVPQKSTPVFVFRIKAQDIYCFLDRKDGKVIEGDPTRLQSVTFQFALKYQPSGLQSAGHPWEIIEVKKLQETPLLV